MISSQNKLSGLYIGSIFRNLGIPYYYTESSPAACELSCGSQQLVISILQTDAVSHFVLPVYLGPN